MIDTYDYTASSGLHSERTPIGELHDDGQVLWREEHLQQLDDVRVARAHALVEQLRDNGALQSA